MQVAVNRVRFSCLCVLHCHVCMFVHVAAETLKAYHSEHWGKAKRKQWPNMAGWQRSQDPPPPQHHGPNGRWDPFTAVTVDWLCRKAECTQTGSDTNTGLWEGCLKWKQMDLNVYESSNKGRVVCSKAVKWCNYLKSWDEWELLETGKIISYILKYFKTSHY